CDKKDELEIERTSSTESTGSRSKREISNSWKNGSYERYNASIHPCDRHDMHIDFDELGLQLIGPKSYNAYQCLGYCKKQEYVSTVYSNIREIIYRRQEVETRDRCCAPNKMTKIPVAYCDRKGQAVLRVGSRFYCKRLFDK
ncbi:dorsalin-1-like, partial [Copidosoma floridanum]|uniref:dorsalin-1-like n=1 Tax=Copidosoma floridanum TaxID=29053 RepID=UPI0006C9A2B7